MEVERSRDLNNKKNMVKYLYVYILKCSDGTYYTGITNNLARRITEHTLGINKDAYTYSRRPVEMIYSERYTDYLLAISWEKRIKKWSKKKKEALISKNWEKLKKAAECKNGTHYNNTSRLRSK